MSRSSTPRSRADVLADAVTRTDLESDRWVSPHHGYHRRNALTDPVLQRVVDAASVMPEGAAVGGWAAAYLHGATYLGNATKPVLVILPPGRIIRRDGIKSLRGTLSAEDVVTRYGIPCTSGVRTTYDVVRIAPTLVEAVVAGDCALSAGLTTRRGLAAYLDRHPARRGVRQLRAALPLLNARAASPPESRLRLLCLDAGLAPMLVNVPVHDLARTFLGIPDLLEPLSALVVEYDGAQHRELEQHTADNAREERLEAAGLTVIRVTALDMRNPTAVQARIMAAYQRCRHRDSSADTWVVLPDEPAAA